MEEGTLRANVIEAKVNNVSVRYERPRNGESDNEIYSQGEVVPAEKIISAAGFKVRQGLPAHCLCVYSERNLGLLVHLRLTCWLCYMQSSCWLPAELCVLFSQG
jgi:hypothetical protein